ncbi:hypothetical protein GCM10007047_05150 [Cerasicoccus arenae]|uniref:histidine kinase n=1 Tax=Cerasicoccus arenae TaxID=424488 RepID=A0A8J3D9A8_9BACT|nr:hypothetical protein GCM10007047_05150 [Cerasicoccus arenae]
MVPSTLLQRLLWRLLVGNVVLRLCFALFGYLGDRPGILMMAGVGFIIYGGVYLLLKCHWWGWGIVLASLEWVLQVRTWVLEWGWESDFQLLLLLLSPFMLLLDFVPLRRRTGLAALPVAAYLFFFATLHNVQPVLAFDHTVLGFLNLLNLLILVGMTAWMVYCFAQNSIQEKVRAEQLSVSRAQLVANLSHELKTPIAAILTTAQSMLRYERSSDKYKQALRLCERNSRSMSQLIRRMLDLSKAGSDAWTPDLKLIDPRDLLSASIDLHTPLANDDGVDLLLVCKGEQSIETDTDLLLIMVNNLLGNAIRYTPRDKAVIIRFIPATTNRPASISVCDEGPGIRPEILPHIFDAFYQDDKIRSRKSSINSNYGLGLALTAELAERLGIKIDVDSSPGEGARFHLILPAPPLTSIPPKASQPIDN